MDIKPDDVPNTLNLRSKGVINVVILTTERFDATWIDVISLRFGATGEESGAVHLMLGFCCLSSAANRVETQTHAYVTNLAQKSISVINTATNTVITTILFGDEPQG